MTTSAPEQTGEVACDLYRDIHKGIRAELFRITLLADATDATDVAATGVLATDLQRLLADLVSHAEHEDGHIQPVVEVHLPAIAEQVAREHEALEARIAALAAEAAELGGASPEVARRTARGLYLDLAGFVSAYLAHQDLEERELLPALQDAIGGDAVLGIHQAILASIPPEELARSLGFMLPAMNVDDRTELFGGMRADAPPEAFDAFWGLAGSVLPPEDHRALGLRLGIP